MIGACVVSLPHRIRKASLTSLPFPQFIASSRQTFAFARDGALPASRFIYSINKYTGTPVNGVIFAGIVSWCLGLITLAGVQATTAIFSLAVCGQYVAYSIPIAARFLGENSFKPGPFSLGRWVSSWFSNVLWRLLIGMGCRVHRYHSSQFYG